MLSEIERNRDIFTTIETTNRYLIYTKPLKSYSKEERKIYRRWLDAVDRVTELMYPKVKRGRYQNSRR